MSLTYVSVLTEEGLLKVPNSSFLAAAVGPWPRSEQHDEAGRLVTVGAGWVEGAPPVSSPPGRIDQSS